tara:strand:- start:432 stop:890 length:459 start_codon:yes stop_codon:yes gene_type:complete
MSEFNYKDFLKNSSFLNEAEEKEEDKVSEDRIEKAIKAVLKKEGGAAGLDPIKDAVKALDVDKDFDLEKTIKDIPSVETHKDGDIIDTDGLKEEEENIEEAEESALSREKKMVMKLLLGKMQDIENANPEELTRDFLIKTKKMIDDLMISDF